MPGRTTPADGWPEFLGYFEGRRATFTAPVYFGGQPWVGHEAPVPSTDDRVTAGVTP